MSPGGFAYMFRKKYYCFDAFRCIFYSGCLKTYLISQKTLQSFKWDSTWSDETPSSSLLFKKIHNRSQVCIVSLPNMHESNETNETLSSSNMHVVPCSSVWFHWLELSGNYLFKKTSKRVENICDDNNKPTYKRE